MNTKHDLFLIGREFIIDGNFIDITPLTGGHINDTYLALHKNEKGDAKYVFQKINRHVFKNPEKITATIDHVTRHIRSKLEKAERFDFRSCLSVVPPRNGGLCHKTPNGDFWRAYYFIDNAKSYVNPLSCKHTYEAAKAFGLFQLHLTDLNPVDFEEAIPGFHDTNRRVEALERAVAEDRCGRVKLAMPEIDFVLGNNQIAQVLKGVEALSEIKQRLVHNDAKLSNVMIDDAGGEAVCVIDLDTIGPGLVHYDFGDLLRSAICPVPENEIDLTRVFVRMDMFEAAAAGYLSHAQNFLSPVEREYLAFSGKLITYEIGVRFLTDYIEGDHYFKISYPEENLNRSRNQFKLVQSLMENENEMRRIIKSL